MNRKGFIYVVVAVAIIVFIVVLISGKNQNISQQKHQENIKDTHEKSEVKRDPDVKQISTYDIHRINEQKQMEQSILKKYNQKHHLFKDPFVTVNPYGTAPLTALVMFETDEPTKIDLTVRGKDKHTNIHKTFGKYQRKHQIPVLGLYPHYKNKITLQATHKHGKTTKKTLSIHTKALPDDFLTTKLVQSKPKRMENGFTFIVPSSHSAYAVDDNAEVRWYSTLWNSHIFRRLENGNLLYITKEEGQKKYNDLLEMDMLGKVYNAYLIHLDGYERTNLIHHDMIELPNGNLLGTTHDVDSDYIEDEMVEINRKTGATVRNFNFRDILPNKAYQNYNGPGAEEGDWLHQNAIWLDQSDHTLLMSSRSQDLVMKFTYPTGKIQWMLAAPQKWPKRYEKYLLKPKGDMKYPGGQHSVMKMPDQDHNPHTIDVLLFDNNTVVTRGNKDLSKKYSRAVQYRINEKKKTVKEIWSYGEKRGKSFFSNIVGDADYLQDTGNRLINSGYIKGEHSMSSRIVEVTDQTPAKVVYEIAIGGFKAGSHRQAYRSKRLPLYPKQDWHFGLDKGR